jgi:hypothetical protein
MRAIRSANADRLQAHDGPCAGPAAAGCLPVPAVPDGRLRRALRRAALVSLLAGGAALLAACDGDRIHALEEGVSTEAQVRQQFGEPDRLWPEADGAHTLEYNRQPAGLRNYMITIGADGRMSALRQVLTPENFARIQPGEMQDDVRRALGRPMRMITYEWRNETEWDWRYLKPPATSMMFSVTFDDKGRVLRTGSMLDPASEVERAGG